MKTAVAALVILLSSFVSAQTTSTTNVFLSGDFLAPDGSHAFVQVERTQDPTTNVVTTDLFFSFCGFPIVANCQEGSGFIPNSALTGQVYADQPNRPDTLTLLVDTSAIAGFQNSLCTGVDQFGNCIAVPATGGLVSLSWTRTNASAIINTISSKIYKLRKLTFTGISSMDTFSASMAGTVLGVQVINPGEASMVSSSDSATLKEKFAAHKGRIE